VRVSQLPENVNLTETGWAVKRVRLDEEIQSIAYHPPSGVYAVCTTTYEEFGLPHDDEYHKNWANESMKT
jgi:cleavage and polyadenylation specificity factor subunit 1